ncbi:roadblock/LC7 domain-containing protein [Saccharothrix coeruleofusca]|uniref:Dynein regulation protein LC7 n=1 Tax=Saccharothrix coeruleofusca TaxID=33919 RepID=A0A918APS0_9PSEU|nr:roadblock/LC7 domain-containing protein [Saccharothrix coeruleofusca]MBP2334952.1 putative regulator of Ras-like GTPase activity (Roadblock/LC7/MglB family) [Saccharothrix coeruleofusca]GGP68153.1 dynein regulation protein LC7 [Saccharothrix coeruleofusca]
MAEKSAQDNDYDWLINDFAERVPGVAHGIAVSADGLLLAASDSLPEDRADQLAAVACGLVSLADGAAQCFEAGNVNETILEMDAGTMLLMSISDGSSLAVLADPGHDVGQIAYEMALLVDRVGRTLTPDERVAVNEGAGA